MILAAGLSPAWQQTVLLERLQVGEVNRAAEVHWCASGKVINVGLALAALQGALPERPPEEPGGESETAGEEPQTLVLIGGMTGQAIADEFARRGVCARWIFSDSPTRVCTTILDRASGATTELVGNAGEIRGEELDAFRQTFREMAPRAEVVVLTGSFPRGAPATLYRELMELTSGRVIIDCQGPPLLAALEARPFVVKPNREELGRTLGLPVTTDAELQAAMRALNERGATWVVVSQGKGRVLIRSASGILSIAPPVVPVVNPIGSGDCLAAGIATGLAAGYDLPEAARFGVAAAAENVRHLLPARIEVPALRRWHETLRIFDGQSGA
jgi:1-phosphofructokinase family hexose kinase